MRTVIDLFVRAVQSGWIENLAGCWDNFIESGDLPLTPGERTMFDFQLPMQQTRNGPLPLHCFPEAAFVGGEWFCQFAQRPEVIEAGERWFNRLRTEHDNDHQT
ncbi:MAG TPA: hypothetical protein VHB77_19755 [Planctomycetaceae bacterium]|nr:hypothetical protein [Planctomycetaceae bacterium]